MTQSPEQRAAIEAEHRANRARRIAWSNITEELSECARQLGRLTLSSPEAQSSTAAIVARQLETLAAKLAALTTKETNA